MTVGVHHGEPLVVLYDVPCATYTGIVEALGQPRRRFAYDHRTLEIPSVLRSVSWISYEAFLRALGDYSVRHTYDRGTLELMPRVMRRELRKSLIRRLIQTLTYELSIPIESVGSTTLWSASLIRAIEPDESFYLANAPRVRGKDEYDHKTDPPPDLVVDVDLAPACLDRLSVFAPFGVREVWRHDGQQLTFHGLTGRGDYACLGASAAFPFLRLADIARFLDMRHVTGENGVIRSFIEWVHS